MNKTRQKVIDFIINNNLINEGDRIIVGLSGGADSVCLICLLNDIKDEMSFSLEAVHVHHGIRGIEADEDENFASRICEKLDIPFASFKRDIPNEARKNHESEEECGRRIRYEIFNQEILKRDNSKIAVAHHMDDQVETILFRMLRGTGIKGIAGMKVQNGNIIRPLLCLSKSEILDYLMEIGQDFKNDSTNEDINYSRNYIRNEIIPKFKEINGNSLNHICSLSHEAMEIEEYLEQEAIEALNEALVECKKKNTQTIRKYKVENIISKKQVIKARIIRRIIAEAGISLKDVNRDHIAQINGILEKSESGQVHLPRGARIKQESGLIYVEKEEKRVDSFQVDIIDEGSYKVEGIGEIKCRIIKDFAMEGIPQSPYTKWLDYDKIKNGLCVRSRQSGDFLVINDEGKVKSLKDYMINEKIPKSERDRIPLIAVDNKICWVIGHRLSADVKITENTSIVLEISFEGE